MYKIGILGYGEIGKAVAKFYKDPLIADRNICNLEEGMHILHVCIPYSKEFKKVILDYNKKYNPKSIVIHSTVEVGTTKELNKKLDNKVVHSPVRGVHPDLFPAIKTFIKYIGYEDKRLAEKIQYHFKEIGIKSEIVEDSRTTELGKLVSTTYYGIVISFTDYIDRLCQKNKLSFKEVLTDFNESYNLGYMELNMMNVMRPTLYPPKGKIGGHCVRPNAKILKKQFGKDPILRSILKVK